MIARLTDGRLRVWSPVRLSAALRGEVDRLGEVAHLVSPNKRRHLYLAEWKAAYPGAKPWGPQSMIRRKRELAFEEPLTDAWPDEWGSGFDQAWFRGSFAMDEIAFFHRPWRTAHFADLIQAFDERFLSQNWSWWSRPLARLHGIAAASPGAPREWRLSFFNGAPARAARARALSWNCRGDGRPRVRDIVGIITKRARIR